MPSSSQPNTTASAMQARLQNNPTLWMAALWVVGLVVTAVLTLWLNSYQQERLKNRFDTELAQVTDDIGRRFQRPVHGLVGTRGVYAASESVNRLEFQRYVESRDLATEFPALRDMGFVQRVQRAELGAFVQRVQADGAPDFAVRSLGDDTRDDLYVVKFIEPLASSRAALGMDIGSEAVRREAAERAARTGQPVLSGVIALVQDSQPRPGFLMYLAVYRPGLPLTTPEERLAALDGLASAAIVLEDLVQPSAALLLANGLTMQITDKPTAAGGVSLFEASRPPVSPALSAEVPLNVLGAPLFVQVQSTQAFEATANRSLVLALGGAGALLSTLLAWVLWLQATGRARAEAQAQQMTLDLKKLALVAERTANAVVMTDAQLRITWVNEGFTRVCGYTLEDALGRTPGDLLGSGLSDPATLKQLKDSAEQGVGCRVEILNRAKDGHIYWLDTEVQPIRDDAGQLTGFIQIGLDVSKDRQTSERLFQAMLEAQAQQQELDVLARVARETTNAVVLTNTEGLIEWINEGFTRITGYTLPEVMGEKPGHFLQCPETDPRTVARIRAAVAQRQPCQEEILNRSKDGRLYWLELAIQPLYGPDGQHTGFMAIQNDVSDRTEAVNRLKRVVQENESLMSAINQGTIYSVANLQGNITDVNDEFVRISGYTRQELIGANHRLLNSGTQSAEFWSIAWDTITSGQVWRGEVCNRNKNGELYWVNSTIVPFLGFDGMVEKYISIRTDITEQKRAQEEIEFQRQRLDNIINGTRAGTWAWHVPSGRTIFNERWADIVGHTLQELGSTTIDTWMGFAHPDDLQASGEALQRHFRGELDFYQVEARMRHRDGHWVWVHDRGQVASREPDGTPGWMYGTHMDITKRKEAENQLLESQALFKELLNLASDWYWETDEQHRFSNFVATQDTENHLAFNKAMLGKRRWEVAGITPLSGDWATHIALHERRENFRNFEYRRVLPNGEVRYYAISGFPVIDSFGEFKGYRGTARDATAQKQQEAELQTARDRIELATESAGIGIWIFDVAHRAMEWDARMFQLYGREAVPVAQIYDLWTSSLHPEDKARVRQTSRDVLSGKQDFDIEFRIVWPNGCLRHIRGTARVQRDDHGQAVRMVGVNFDVTEQRERERKIAAEEMRLRAIYDILPVGISITDPQGQIIDCNPASERLLGISKADHLARNYAGKEWLINREDGTPMPMEEFASVRALTQQIQVHDEVMQIVTDQHSAWLSVSAMPVAHEDFGVVIAYVDITAGKQAQEKIAHSEALLRGAIGAVGEAFVLYDPQDRLVFCNERYREVYADVAHLMKPGVPFESLVRAGAELGHYAEAIGRVDEWVAERVARHRAGDSDMLQKHANGRTLRIIERRMPDGHTVGFRIDITDLVRAKEQALEASRSKGDFLANMSHEIRTPMNAILGMLKLMHSTPLQPRQLDYVEKTEGAAKSLLGLLNDILDFSKVEAGKMTLDPQPLRLDQLMRNLSVIFSANLGNKPVEVLFDIDPRVPRTLLVDHLRLQQILINLGGNAIKFTDKGEVVVQVRLEDLQGQPPERQARVRFAVKDSGIGIAPENQHKIFTGFTQAEASTTRRFGGTGLGLSISRRLIEIMGGQLALQSAVGQGSTFSFSVVLPVVETANEAGATAITSAPWCTPGMPVLVVDDNPVARELMANMGDSLGWNLETVDSGEAALACIAERNAQGKPYQAIFVDWMMPGLDGWQTSARIRSLIAGGSESTASPLIMMVSAHGREMLLQQTTAVQNLINGYLVKPVTASMLFDAMQLAIAPDDANASAPASTQAVQQPLAGLRILLVEDNAINQQVAEELLSGQGAAIDIADNGLRGVQAVQAAVASARPYDAVLMDMQMPVMDGLTATREIRTRLAVADLPIIAMTANAMAGDREACLAAGMNDHVGKPFDLERLVATLLQWTRGASAADAAQALAPAPLSGANEVEAQTEAEAQTQVTQVEAATRPALPHGNATAIGTAMLNRKGALQRVGGSAHLLNRLSTQFLVDLPGLVRACEAIEQPAQQGEALRALHALKGVAATIGADALADAAGEAEQRGKSGLVVNLDPLRQVVAQTQQALLHIGITAPVEPASADPTGGEAQPTLSVAQRDLLQRLLPLLEASDLSVLDAMEELLAHAQGDPQHWAALDSEVQAMAFDRAAQLVRQWLR